MKQLEAFSDQLGDDEEASSIKKQLGIIDEEDAGYLSPEKKASKKID